MLNDITIKDFAIIDNISLHLKNGLNMLTGETGAGKSIVIEAISMALGARADTTYVRTGKDKAVIELGADVKDPDLLDLLRENGLHDGNNLFIVREIHAEGKSVCRINGTLVSVSLLNKICKRIADIHGQYDHQSLLDPTSHIRLLDSYNRAGIEPAIQAVAVLFEKYTVLNSKRNTILKNKAESARNRDFMEFELSEINQAEPTIGEDDSLLEQLAIQKNSETLYSTLSEVYELLYGQTMSSHDNLGKSTGMLEEIKSFSSDYAYLAETVADCFYRLDDLQSEIRNIRDSITFSEEAINETQERIDLIERLKKKYGGTIENVLTYKKEIEGKLAQIEDADNTLESLAEEITNCEKELNAACEQLTSLRKKTAKQMEKDIEKELKELNFQDTTLTVSIHPLKEQEGIKYTSMGTDFVEFQIITNKGEQSKPLSKIASGGEISRIMLAFKSIFGKFDRIPTLIFDEIDSGISGMTASIVGKKMKEISKTHQVICITHLAQIAAFSDHHYQITKNESDGRTATSIRPLNENEKVREIARLLGGIHVTDATLKNAEELISESSK
ncbi:MAG TPA: DNA repair protein RecN [Anaerovoracaceae bacterium]|nr:DNA repair protein RecN [Anaerovoracaceae bacterium]